ncbi:MAG: hypothetical protein AAGA87_09955 [Pseudomonadota bacterium]
MTSLATRYAQGDHEAVWRELNPNIGHRAPGEPPVDYDELFARHRPTLDEIEDVMRQTFERVALNTDRLIERLRDTGYRFECEAGRRRSEPMPPRSPCGQDCSDLKSALEERFGDIPWFQYEPDSVHEPTHPFPMALELFGEIVGTVDLSQRHEYLPSFDESIADFERLIETDPEFADLMNKPVPPGIADFVERMQEGLDDNGLSTNARDEAVRLLDSIPHPHADDPVLSRLGDWDPLQVVFDYAAFQIRNEDLEMYPVPGGGIALHGEIAQGWAHKANISGASNVDVRFPSVERDPIVYAEGIRLPFSFYLRRMFARGGFYGTPSDHRRDELSLREVEPGIFLPDHPIFETLARDLEPF